MTPLSVDTTLPHDIDPESKLEKGKTTPATDKTEPPPATDTSKASTPLVLLVLLVLVALYCFLVGLNLMGDSFKVLAGKTAGNLFAAADHPIAGLMVGILATVLVQSSSTSTSIVVGLVGTNIMPVAQAIYVIMGANIGTSVTNTLVSLGHVKNPQEYERAFAGATVHDMFNVLCVLVLLPVEWIVQGITGTGGMLYWITHAIVEGGTHGGGTFESPLKTIVKPVSKAFLSVDKDIIKALSFGEPNNATCIDKEVAGVDFHVCGNATQLTLSKAAWDEDVVGKPVMKGGAFKHMGDNGGGTVGLVLSLVVLCLALFTLVWALKRLFLGRAKRCIQKSTDINGYVAIVVGAAMTVAVQSSSIITSALTPLVGIGTLTLEKMLPLTLGANIGTTCTGLLAALVVGTDAAVQIALCHLMFNVIGILIWYPIPTLRQIPIRAATWLGANTKHKWFPIVYVVTCFVLVPLAALGISALIRMGGVAAAAGWVGCGIVIVGSCSMVYVTKCRRTNVS